MRKPRKPKEPVKASNVFQCESCEGKPTFEGNAAMKAHLVDVHKLTKFKGTKRMLMHLDCADSYVSQFEWEIGRVKLTQATCNPRTKV